MLPSEHTTLSSEGERIALPIRHASVVHEPNQKIQIGARTQNQLGPVSTSVAGSPSSVSQSYSASRAVRLASASASCLALLRYAPGTSSASCEPSANTMSNFK